MELFRQCFFALGNYVLAGLLLRLFNIDGASGSLNIFGHLSRDILVLADEISGVAQFMPFCVPQEVQEEEVVLSAK